MVTVSQDFGSYRRLMSQSLVLVLVILTVLGLPFGRPIFYCDFVLSYGSVIWSSVVGA